MRVRRVALMSMVWLCWTAAVGASGEYVVLGGVTGILTRPQRAEPAHVALVYDNGAGSPMPAMCTQMAERGFLTWCALSRVSGEGGGDWTNVALEVKSAVEFLRRQPGIRSVVLYGHSGGGAVASFYQAVAENGAAYCRDPHKFAACSAELDSLPPADAVVFPDAHPGMDVMSLRGLNPSLQIAGDRVRVNASLDPFSSANGFNPQGASHYPEGFQKRYFAAQAAQMQALSRRAVALRAARSRHADLSPAAELIVVPGFGIATHLDELDPSIALTMSTVRPERLLRNDGSIVVQPIHSVWTGYSPFVHFSQDLIGNAASFLALRAVRATDSMTHIDWCSANSDTVCNTAHIHVPVLFMAAGASDFIADEERMFDGSPAPDKEFLVVEGALHDGSPCTACEAEPGQYANSRRNQYDYLAHWINARFDKPQPQTPVTGDLHRQYRFEATGEQLPYRLYVPSGYNGREPVALVVVLHGYGGGADAPFDDTPPGMQHILQREAERHGFIVLAPQGYDGRGDYGAHLSLPVHNTVKITHSDEDDDRAEADVLDAMREVERDYRIDRRRIYLMGNSMGMTGTLYLAQKYPDRWCAIGPSDGPPWADYPVQRARGLSGAIFVNGDLDKIALTAVNRALADRFRDAGIDTRFVAVPEGEHGTAWYKALPQMFDFFAAHRCSGVQGGDSSR